MTHCEQVLAALRDGEWHTTADLYRLTGGFLILHSRISDLRKKGHNVEGRHVPGHTGADGYEYRLLPSVTYVDVPKSCCPEHTDGNQCIYDRGHQGQHFAKDEWSYYMWTTPQVRRAGILPPLAAPPAEQLVIAGT